MVTAGADDLRPQHDKLHVGVTAIAALRDELLRLDPHAAGASLDETLLFLRYEVGPHARAEEMVLYPALATMLGVHLGRTLVGEHRQIERLIADVTASRYRMSATGRIPSQLHRQLAALVDRMNTHLRQEEEVRFGMVDEVLTSAEAHTLCERMEEATIDAVAELSSQPATGVLRPPLRGPHLPEGTA